MEPIKQEIINNIFENGDKLITGPILQTVLIDMIDDVNVKDQEILSKTGSWDDAVTQIPNLATKAEVTNLSESVARDLTGYATEQWVQDQGYLKEHQDISNLATKTELTEAKNNLQGNITSLSESVARDIANVSVPEGVATEAWVQSQDYASKTYVNDAVASSSVDLTGYATETWVQNQGYLTEHQDISGLATKTELTSVSESVQTDITNLSESVANSAVWKKGEGQDSLVQVIADGTDQPTATGNRAVATGKKTTASGPYSHAEGNWTRATGQSSHAEGGGTEATGQSSHAEGAYAKASGMASHAEGYYAKASNYYSHAEGYHTNAEGESSHAEGYFTTASANYSHAEGSGSIASGLASHAEGNHAEAKGQYSHAEGIRSRAENPHSHAEGFWTVASADCSHAEGGNTYTRGQYSHAEGYFSNASGRTSHAEGSESLASGQASHAEGYCTTASNNYEHAQGQYNHNSTNQIFSVGAGEKIGETVTRRNAVSILEVPNSDTQVVTASFFVQNVGGYDGTNPEPGTNDLATVINGLSSSGGSSETLWKKGTGPDSIVSILTEDREVNTPTATGTGSIAIGESTKASGKYSHAEGSNTKALRNSSHAEGSWTRASGDYSHAEGDSTETNGSYSHAEGSYTNASGKYSHAEGNFTRASNEYEHAQGTYNHNSPNQIFSVGAGEFVGEVSTRRNAISVLAVPNSETQINTASFFVQNVGGYDGTNPIPGTNDLATVISGLSSGGGSSSGGSSETLWKKGTGEDSVVQKVTDTTLTEPIASGIGAVAIGDNTKALGQASHAEGYWTEAKGNNSHAEGRENTAKGVASHAEGFNVIASNSYEHAQGIRNYNSTNQIFSVGAGDYTGNYVESSDRRRNAISVLAVPNSETQVVTASFFVQNIGGYDGTNPTPGTNDLATVINGMSSGGGSSETLWKKGEGGDSIVQAIADGTHLPTATGNRAIAVGYETTASGLASHAEGCKTTASGDYSHAEGWGTNASNAYCHAEGNSTVASGFNSHAEGYNTIASTHYSHAEGTYATASGMGSHAEGRSTKASGDYSHTEGSYTVTSNQYEHAQGRYNHNSENQIFSIGTGNSNTDRRNAVSVLEVDNSGSYTSSFFVQNVGGYDGTNPTPGTNDLATVLNNTETWTFTLEDGSTVTKNVRIS